MTYEVEMLNITKEFPGIKANDNVSLRVKKGSIHALLGENGAGKSTLMSILFGLYKADSGVIKVRGKEVTINDPNDAADLGIGMVHQHFKLVDDFTVTQNIILGSEPTTKMRTINYKEVNKEIKKISNDYKLAVDPTAKIQDISVGAQQRVEILKMLYRDAEILIFDEPTAVLTPQEIEELIATMRELVDSGKTILLITHKLKEIMQVADECSILRRGKYVGTVNVSETSERELAELMVGREVDFNVYKPDKEAGKPVLEIEHLNVMSNRGLKAVKDLSLTVHAGEILGIAGIDGNGQDEFIYALSGLTNIESGTIKLNGEEISKLDIRTRTDRGLGHIPSDRHRHGLILDFFLEENFIIHDYNKRSFSHYGILDFPKITSHAVELIDEFDVRVGAGPKTLTRSMSGGNQQKAIIARELYKSPDCLLVVQPTRGLDVGAIEYIHSRIIEERNNGKAILLVSFELDEIMAMSDRIAVISGGEITGIVKPQDTNENDLGLMMTGVFMEELGND
ncbi:MAG: ABC transporter ATP-binding protein [Erysipelothrix sp.]|nr:ABC transporter ATP-binding protein [Erysipelothrix sp.]